MQLLLPTLYALLFIFLICKMNFFVIPQVSAIKLVVFFVLKLIAGSFVFWVYTHHYSGSDFFTYFSDSTALIKNTFGGHAAYSAAWNGNFENVLFSSSRVMIVLNAILQLFSGGNFYVHAVFFCFFSFIGLTALLKAFLVHFPNRRTSLILALFFIPSILFWGSAALKESVIIGIVGMLVYLTDFGLRKKYTFWQLLLIAILLLLLLFVKIYVLCVLLVLLLINAVVARTSTHFLLLKYSAGMLLLGLFAFAAAALNPDYNVLRLISDKQAKAISEANGGVFLANQKHFVRVDYDQQKQIVVPENDSIFHLKPGSSYTRWKLDNMRDTTFITASEDTSAYRLVYSIQPARSVIKLKRLKPKLADFIAYSPHAFVNTLIHPTVFEITSKYHLLIALENIAIIILILLAIIFFDKTALKKKEVLLFCLFFAIILFVLIGITTPAIGAMVRYKTIALLFLAPACFMMISVEKAMPKLMYIPYFFIRLLGAPGSITNYEGYD
ncbi:MAG: hypothetical protein JWP12_1650 [Bacteroidetes bacterium]|nr:hypothetical protein [Bacteroidota bacterium]